MATENILDGQLISELTPTEIINGAEEFVIERNGQNYKVTTEQMKAHFQEGMAKSTDIKTKTSQLNNDSHFVSDQNYQHTDNNFTTQEKEKLAGIVPGGGGAGSPGKSAYEVAVENGYQGTEEEWLASLKGPQGDPGQPGAPGANGATLEGQVLVSDTIPDGTEQDEAVPKVKAVKEKISSLAEKSDIYPYEKALDKINNTSLDAADQKFAGDAIVYNDNPVYTNPRKVGKIAVKMYGINQNVEVGVINASSHKRRTILTKVCPEKTDGWFFVDFDTPQELKNGETIYVKTSHWYYKTNAQYSGMVFRDSWSRNPNDALAIRLYETGYGPQPKFKDRKEADEEHKQISDKLSAMEGTLTVVAEESAEATKIVKDNNAIIKEVGGYEDDVKDALLNDGQEFGGNVVAYNTNKQYLALQNIGAIEILMVGNIQLNDLEVGIINVVSKEQKTIKTIPSLEIPSDGWFRIVFDKSYSLKENETFFLHVDRFGWVGKSAYGGSVIGTIVSGSNTISMRYLRTILSNIPTFYTKKESDSRYVRREILTNYNQCSIGSIPFQGFVMNGYNHIILYGQSLSTGDATWVPVTGALTPTMDDVLMIGEDPCDARAIGLSQMVAKKPATSSYSSPNGGESPIVNACYALKNILSQTIYANSKIIGTACGYGGKSINDLSKGQTCYERYTTTLASAKSLVKSEPIVCPAIIWMQGEYDGEMPIAEYKTKILKLKNDMQADVKVAYSQKNAPLFFVYQTSPEWGAVNVSEALRQFAEENSDVILMNPLINMPLSTAGHMTPNGSRWYGEYIAKAINSSVLHAMNFESVSVRKIEANGDRIYLHCYVPNPPLQINTLQSKAVKNYGFHLEKGGVEIPIKSVEIFSSDIILITLANPNDDFSGCTFDYAHKLKWGNICDSDGYSTGTNVFDWNEYPPITSGEQDITQLLKESDSGHNIVAGKSYPLHNWLNSFIVDL